MIAAAYGWHLQIEDHTVAVGWEVQEELHQEERREGSEDVADDAVLRDNYFSSQAVVLMEVHIL